MDETGVDEVHAHIDALAMRNEVRRIALRELIRLLPLDQAHECSRRIQNGIALLLKQRGPLKAHEDEATALELATILASLGRSERSGFMHLGEEL